MSTEFWISSTGKPVVSSAGASPLDCMSFWALDPSDETLIGAITSYVPTAFAWRENLPGAQLGHYVKMHGELTEGMPRVYLYQALGKALCHVLVSMLPDAALPELGENLTRLYRFYSTPAPTFMLEPPKLRSVDTVRGAIHPRPEIEITEE